MIAPGGGENHTDRELLQDTLRLGVDRQARLQSIRELPMVGKGYSGAMLRRFGVRYVAGNGEIREQMLVVKDAFRVERRCLTWLQAQGLAAIPNCHTLDLDSPAPAPLCMQYLEPDQETAPSSAHAAARALAAIHFHNLGKRAALDWLPLADAQFFRGGYVLDTFRKAWSESLADPAFRREYDAQSAPLESAAQRFCQAMEDLWQDGRSLTLIHGDLHHQHLIVQGGQPYLIDWEQAHYGSLFLDLPNLFTPLEAQSYFQALTELGARFSASELTSGYRTAGQYVGFKYLGFVMGQWAQRDEPGSRVRASLENLIHLALEGAEIT